MLKRPELICFDMDGTLYQDHVVYPRIIQHFFADTPYSSWIPQIQEQIQSCLRGEGPLKCGQFVPKEAAEAPKSPMELFRVPAVSALLLEDPGPYLDRTRYAYISDGWTMAMYLARRIGWEGERFWTRFRRAREDLVDPRYGPKPDAELVELLAELRGGGIDLVLCSNAGEEGGRALLAYLGLTDSFDQVIFDADKPHTFPERMASWPAAPEQMLFVGDQGYFDLYAGARAGADTLLISPYAVMDAELWDLRVDTLAELKEVLRSLT